MTDPNRLSTPVLPWVRVLLAPALLLGVVPEARAAGEETFVSYEGFLVEEREPGNVVQIPNADSSTGTTSASLTQDFSGNHGINIVSLFAQVASQGNGAPELRVFARHAFTLTGESTEDHVWQLAQSTLLARASLVDELEIANVSGLASLDLSFVWSVEGLEHGVIDIEPPEQLLYDFQAPVRLRLTQPGPPPGPGVRYEETLRMPNGLLEEDLDRRQYLTDQVAAKVAVGTGRTVSFVTALETEPTTSLLNEAENLSTFANGEHFSRFEETATLIGVVVQDESGAILPDVVITSSSGYVYPVLGAFPPEPEPTRVLIGATAVATDLGTFSAEVPPERMIDQSGLDKPYTSGETDFDAYFGLGPVPWAQASPYTNSWQSVVDFDLPVTGTIDFDLDDAWWVDRVVIWNRSLAEVGILFALEPGGPWTDAGSVLLDSRYPFPFSYPADVVELAEPVEARHLRLEVRAAHEFSAGDGFAYASVGEVAAGGVLSTVSIPEPALGPLGAGALAGLAGLAARRGRALRAADARSARRRA